ncbi:hypothetical protein [Paraflavitalea pollutisoli]|uniref:hypothetical protein n=1 Tax=Paraflavitalea pollutisoli TaxID=3034143 RepID=UPI0023EC97E4|nr:hypothetical protein [Paraflavitalea sp. H1-2-19X]
MDKREYKFLAWGYKAAIVLAIVGIIASSSYLFYYLYKSDPQLIKVETMVGFSAERRMVLLSTGIFVAMSFGFLGFALFLIQAKGEIEGSLDYKSAKVNIVRMSPGIFVILCATVIIIFCATFRIDYSAKFQGDPTQPPQQNTSQGTIEDPLPTPDYNFREDTIPLKDSTK